MKKIIITLLCSSFLFLNNVSANESEISKSVSEFIYLHSQDINEDKFEVGDCSNVSNWSWASIRSSLYDPIFWYQIGKNYLGLYDNKYYACLDWSEETYLRNINVNFRLPEEDQKNYSLNAYHWILRKWEDSPYLKIDNEHLILSHLWYCYSQAETIDFLRACLYNFAKQWEYAYGWNINKNNQNQSFYNEYEAWLKKENNVYKYFEKIDWLMPKLYSKFKNESNKIADFWDTIKEKIDSTNNELNKRIFTYIRDKILEYLIANNNYKFFVDRYDLEVKSDFLRETKVAYLSYDELSDKDIEEIKQLSKKIYDLDLITIDWGGYPVIHTMFKESKYYDLYYFIIKVDYRIKEEERMIKSSLKYNSLKNEK